MQNGVKIVREVYKVAGDVSLQELKSFGRFAGPLQAVSFPCPVALNLQPTVETLCSPRADTDWDREAWFWEEELSISAYLPWSDDILFPVKSAEPGFYPQYP